MQYSRTTYFLLRGKERGSVIVEYFAVISIVIAVVSIGFMGDELDGLYRYIIKNFQECVPTAGGGPGGGGGLPGNNQCFMGVHR